MEDLFMIGVLAALFLGLPLALFKPSIFGGRGKGVLVSLAAAVACFIGFGATTEPRPSPAPQQQAVAAPDQTTPQAPAQASAATATAAPAQAAPPPPAPAPDPAPAAQRQLIALLQDYGRQFRAAPNEMAAGALRPQRATAICQALGNSLAVQDWIGTVDQLTSTNGGYGVLVVRLARDVTVKTWNNELADNMDHTLLQPNSPIFTAAVALRRGLRVRFSGSFFRSREDCVRETSISQRGSMTEPDLLFRFTAIGPVE